MVRFAIQAAMFHVKKRRSAEAVELFELVLHHDPVNELAFERLTKLHEAMGNWAELARVLESRFDQAAPMVKDGLRGEIHRVYRLGLEADRAAALKRLQTRMERVTNDSVALDVFLQSLLDHSDYGRACQFLCQHIPMLSDSSARTRAVDHLGAIIGLLAKDEAIEADQAQVWITNSLQMVDGLEDGSNFDRFRAQIESLKQQESVAEG